MSTHTSATTNYALQQPSYGYTDQTTEFDDALLQRGIVSMEQVLLAKGMSNIDIQYFIQKQKEKGELAEGCMNVTQPTTETNCGENTSDDDDSELDGDDEFLRDYNRRRIMELQEIADVSKQDCKSRSFGDVIIIDRTEWKRHVNDDSMDCWVVVCLSSSHDSERTEMIEKAIYELATIYIHTKFVLIPSHRAIAQWPDTNLPSLFLYRGGVMQHELIRLPVNISTDQLEDRLTDLNVL